MPQEVAFVGPVHTNSLYEPMSADTVLPAQFNRGSRDNRAGPGASVGSGTMGAYPAGCPAATEAARAMAAARILRGPEAARREKLTARAQRCSMLEEISEAGRGPESRKSG